MSRRLHISESFSLPLEVAGEAVAILGKRGGGKSNSGRVLVEELIAARIQSIILDPVGSWWGLRHGREGSEGIGLPILGGQKGDVPLEPTAGTVIADVVVDSGQSFVLDLSDFPSRAATTRFVADFAERLYRRKARAKSLLHLVLEESDEVAPQKIRKGDETAARMLGAIEAIVRRGRSRGLGVTFITQRSAVLNKDVLTQADVLIVMRTTGPQDVKAIKEWIAYHDADDAQEVLASLGSLRDGEAWIWNPERGVLKRVQIRLSHSFDSGATPKAGHVVDAPTEAAPVDLALLGEQIAATVERAKKSDPVELGRQIRDLERELIEVRRKPAEVSQVEIQVPVFPEPLKQAIRQDYESLASYIEGAKVHVDSMLERARERLDDDFGLALEIAPPTPVPVYVPPRLIPSRTPAATAVSLNGGDTTKPQERVLGALAWLEAIGVSPADRVQCAFVARYSPRSGSFNNLLSQLRNADLVEYPGTNQVLLTDAGAAAAPPVRAPLTGDELRDAVFEKLKAPQAKILRILVDVYNNARGNSLTRDQIAEASGYSAGSGNFNNLLSQLKTLGVIEYPRTGEAVASALLFPEYA